MVKLRRCQIGLFKHKSIQTLEHSSIAVRFGVIITNETISRILSKSIKQKKHYFWLFKNNHPSQALYPLNNTKTNLPK
jgi:hypothetical protein